jgi:hypothetical protein
VAEECGERIRTKRERDAGDAWPNSSSSPVRLDHASKSSREWWSREIKTGTIVSSS